MKVVSLFTGCGGLDLGLIKAGHEIILATDIDDKIEDGVKPHKTLREAIGNLPEPYTVDADNILGIIW
jgi:site-specific DNA-cytosine methylase